MRAFSKVYIHLVNIMITYYTIGGSNVVAVTSNWSWWFSHGENVYWKIIIFHILTIYVLLMLTITTVVSHYHHLLPLHTIKLSAIVSIIACNYQQYIFSSLQSLNDNEYWKNKCNIRGITTIKNTAIRKETAWNNNIHINKVTPMSYR